MDENKLLLLSVCAHSADTIKAAGGTLAKYTQEGHRAKNITFFGKRRVTEPLRKAYDLLGIEYEMWKGEHKELHQGGTWEKIVKLVAMIREYKPDIIFTHDPTDEAYGSFDHGVVGRLVTTACAYASGHGDDEGNMLPGSAPHRVKLMLYYISDMWTPSHISRKPDLFIDISNTIKLKDEAWRISHSGQKGHVTSLLKENRHVASRMYGVVSGCHFAEAFTLPYDRLGRIAMDKIPGEWLTSYRLPGEDHENLSLPEDF